MSIRVGLIGCGAWGEKILRALVASARAEVVAAFCAVSSFEPSSTTMISKFGHGSNHGEATSCLTVARRCQF